MFFTKSVNDFVAFVMKMCCFVDIPHKQSYSLIVLMWDYVGLNVVFRRFLWHTTAEDAQKLKE